MYERCHVSTLWQHKGCYGKAASTSSTDLNPAEDLGVIIKDRVEDRMLNEEGRGRCSHQTLSSNLEMVLHDLEHDTELFAELLLSFRHRLYAVVAAAGGHTDY